MVEVMISVFWGSFFDIFFGGGLDELDGFFFLATEPATDLMVA